MMMKEDNFVGHPSLAQSPLNLTLIALASHALALLALTLLAFSLLCSPLPHMPLLRLPLPPSSLEVLRACSPGLTKPLIEFHFATKNAILWVP